MPHPGTPKGRSSTSLKEDGKKKTVKKFVAGKPLARNASYGKNLNKLTRIRSNEFANPTQETDTQSERPKFMRSKSSGEMIRVKSASKLATLTPHNRTTSLTNLQRHHQKHPRPRVHLELKNNDSEKSGDSDDSEEEVESFDDDANVVEIEPANLVPESASSVTKIPEYDLEYSEEQFKQKNEEIMKQQQEQRKKQQQQQQDVDDSNQPIDQNGDRLYNSSFLLSQSTGQERPVYHNLPPNLNNNTNQNVHAEDHLDYFAPSENLNRFTPEPVPHSMTKTDSGASLVFQQSGVNLRGLSNSVNNKSAQTLTHQLPNRNEAYGINNGINNGNNNTINRQNSMHGLTPLSVTPLRKAQIISSKHQQKLTKPKFEVESEDAFEAYLAPERQPLETRIQQGLRLQSNFNSLEDYANSNAFVTMATKNEFDKLSREYLNIRRYNNPVLDSFERLKEIPEVNLKINKTRTTPTENTNSQAIVNSLGSHMSQSVNSNIKNQTINTDNESSDNHKPAKPIIQGPFFRNNDMKESNKLLIEMWKGNCKGFGSKSFPDQDLHQQQISPVMNGGNNKSRLPGHQQRLQYNRSSAHSNGFSNREEGLSGKVSPLQQSSIKQQRLLFQQQQQQQQRTPVRSYNSMQYQPTTRAQQQQQQQQRGSAMNLVNIQ